jgi:valyl-tRNA synthetase
MKQELDKAYNPGVHEDEIYQKWEKSGFFNPDNLNLSKDAKSYTIVLPPPNITDRLHMGHTVMVAVEDLLIRYHRLAGFRTLWIPGTDHAAIATQNVVEKNLLREQGKTRQDLGKEKFLAEVWKFLEVTQGEILHQIRKLGASLDWSRLAFTFDEPRQAAVRQMFKGMYDEGVIYRGERIVNWCPRCQSTLADDEVEYKEQLAKIYTFKYDRNFPMAISTTRPETKLGDTAVAVNPKDERYKQYIGREYEVDFCGQPLKIKIIADRNVDADFGTGALGVTPAHSMVDWQMAQANDLPVIKVIDENAKIYPGFGKFSGLSVEAARQAVVEELKQRGLLEQEADLTNNLSVCYRCGTAIEPLPSRQWFISVDKKLERWGGQSLKERAIEAAEQEKIKFYPERFKKRYCDWMHNLHDWCISRQIWFGHQIPVWYRGQEIYVDIVPPTGEGWQQDPDTLDTWFSSGMWTFSTLGWPANFKDGKKINDLAKFHPTQMLETGYEIITLWVSRMIMMSLFALDEIPFSQVYLHGMILDQEGKKMSKSKGNGVDPLDIIARFGADAARLSILMDATPGNDSRFSEAKVEAKRNFINKFWNISRFILAATSEESLSRPAAEIPSAASLADKWILAELQKLINSTTRRLDNLEFSLAAEDLYDFTWSKLADWYLEIAKIEKHKEAVLIYILRNLLILWHPLIPYVTEAIWDSFNDSLLMVAQWPKTSEEPEVNSDLIFIQEVIVAIRNARSLNKIEPAQKLTALIYGHNRADLLASQQALLLNLKTGLSSVEIKDQGTTPERAIAVIASGIEIYLLGAVDEAKEKPRLLVERAKLEKLILNQTQKLANSDFVGRAPAAIVAAEQAKLAGYQSELAKIIKIISSL